MTALSILLHTRPLGWRSAPLVLPVWPVVVLALALWGATCCSGASAASKNPAPAVLTEADWLGRSREDVVAAMGKPLSALRRGDSEVLMYAKDVRFEIREDEVVSYRAGGGPAIVAKDGTRYAATARGKVERMAPPIDTTTEDDEVDIVKAVPTAAAAPVATAALDAKPAPSKTPVAPVPVAAVGDDALEPADPADAAAESWINHPPEMPDGSKHPMAMAAEDLASRGLMPMAEPEQPKPAWVRPVREIVGALLRFGFALLILRIAISWAELPCYLPDVAKVAALTVIIREGVHGLANFGGHWEWIRLFMIDDVASYFALMLLLCKFKVALSGLTALKIATATISVNYFLMLMVGVVLSFMIG